MGKKKKKESIEQSIAAYGSGRRVYYPREDLQNSALWSCVVNLSRLYASMPWHAYKVMPNGDRKKEEGSVLAALLKKPNAYMTSYDFRFVMGFNFEMRGEAVAIIKRSRSGFPIALWPVSPSSIVAMYNGGSISYTLALTGETYDVSDVLIIKNTPIGYGAGAVLDPMRYAKDDIDLAQKCKDMQAEYYDGASVVGNNISVPSQFTKDQRDELKRMFDSARGFRNYVTDERIKINPIQVQNADIAKLSEAEKWSAIEVARRFNVPPFLIGDTTGTYANSEQQGLFMVTYCLGPRIAAWEAALNDSLCRQNEYVKFSMAGMLRGDHATRSNYYLTGLQYGWLTVNDVRSMEELSGIGPDGDVHFFPLSVGSIHDVASGKYAGGGNNSGMNAWKIPSEKKIGKPEKETLDESREKRREEKRKHDLLFVEEAQKPAKNNRSKLERMIRLQISEAIDKLKELVATGAPTTSVLSDLRTWLDSTLDNMTAAYKDIYFDVLKKMVPVIQSETGKDDDVSDSSIDSYASVYARSMAERIAGKVASVANASLGTEEFEDEISTLKQDYPIDQSEEETNRASNAFSIFLFSQLHVSVFHVVAASNSCGFCGTLDGKIASVDGYVLTKGSDVDTGDGGVRHIEKNYKHPPFHSHCRCSVAPGE